MVAVWEYFRKPWCSKVGVLGILLLCIGMGYKPLLAVYYQQRAGRELAQVTPLGQNDYGGFACLRPFIEDLEQRQKLKRAEGFLTKSSQVMPKLSHTYYQLGRVYCLLGDYERSIPAFQTFSDLRPKNPLANLELGFALLQVCPPNGKCLNGLNAYDVWRNAGVRAEDFLVPAATARQRENYSESLLWYQSAQRMGLELRGTILYVRFLHYRQLGDEQKAREMLKKAAYQEKGWMSQDEHIFAMFEYANTMLLQEGYVEAEKFYIKVLKLIESEQRFQQLRQTIIFHLGSMYAYTGQSDKALPLLKISIENNPTNFYAYLNYGIALYWKNSHELDLVKRYFDEAIKVSGDSLEAWESVIAFWRDRNLLSEQEAYCRRAMEQGISSMLCPSR
jgi:tetratricopeptide (TPR) repeat protein